LYFLALCSSGVAGLAASLYLSIELVFSIGFGIAFFLMFVFFGTQFIKYKLSDLIESSVYPDCN
ncbi:MAG: hypothetical protein Q8P34_03890, partial [Bacteroidota bacterium]|nr:hypothetical protein [Bacteroidota bacterium]